MPAIPTLRDVVRHPWNNDPCQSSHSGILPQIAQLVNVGIVSPELPLPFSIETGLSARSCCFFSRRQPLNVIFITQFLSCASLTAGRWSNTRLTDV